MKLAVHEDGDETLIFRNDTDLARRLDEVRHSTLTAWFHYNFIHDDQLDQLYIKFPRKEKMAHKH
jgi:hypothetical protein